ncbi:hypothetical protein AGABI2DRAFT_203217, partial [Agaricus bisporus var. bisporus H97]|uniref:hypothetical protein n=1 Tax=Agaricus bisporus var. bisporus (strain H97 / ATCC MYA-4626 / FGSC 10389) TaxID=936046 RepID=UPI00029F71C9
MSGIHIPNILLAIPRNPVTAVGLPLALGYFGGFPASKAVNTAWYHRLSRPPLCPPRQAFPLVWPLLYLAMGYASHIAVKELDSAIIPSNRDDLSLGLALYYGQLGLNCIWTTLFFEKRSPILALVDSVLVTGTTFYMTTLWDAPTNARATYLLLPYCAWMGYATYMNAGFWWLNRDSEKSA